MARIPLIYTYTELLHFPQRGEVKSTIPKVPFHSDLQIQLFYRLLTTTKKGASEKETYFQERKKEKKEKPFSHMHFVVKGNIYHHQTPACQNMFPPKHKKGLKLREKHVQFKDEMKCSKDFQSVYHQPRARCQDNIKTRKQD